MNKKAAFDTTQELILWIPRIILLVVVLGTTIFIITSPIKENFDIDDLQQIILRQRFIYSNNCLAYENELGFIDQSKFNKARLENCFQNDEIGVNLNLITDKKETINLNEKISNKFNLCFDTKHFECTNYTYGILFIEGNNVKSGLLNIAMVKLK